MNPLLTKGQELRSTPRSMSRERMRWYVDGLFTAKANDGKVHTEENIHTDDQYARSQGLPGIIADGMISTNWILSLLVDVFGPDAASKGRLKTKYIAPIYEDHVVIACAKIATVTNDGGRAVYDLAVWCEDDNGKKVTVGDARVYAPAR